MKKMYIRGAAISAIVASNMVVASDLPKISAYFDNPVVLDNAKTTLRWISPNANNCSAPLVSTTNQGSYTFTASGLGVKSTRVVCSNSAGTTTKDVKYFVIHDGPAGAMQTFKDAGGGKHYSNGLNVSQGSGCLNVRSYAQLESCIAGNETTIFVPGDVVIDAPSAGITLENNVKLVSDRGVNGSEGAIIRFTGSGTGTAIRMKSHTRVSGFRIHGPTPSGPEALHNDPDTVGISVGYNWGIDHKNGRFNKDSEFLNVQHVTIDNNEIFNWSYAGIRLGYSSRHIDIKNNFIHDNRDTDYGYGILSNSTEPPNYNYSNTFVYKNIFSKNRHDVASSGYAGNSYEALYNINFDGAVVGYQAFNNAPLRLSRYESHACSSRTNLSCDFVNGNFVKKSSILSSELPHTGSGTLLSDYNVMEEGQDAGRFFYIVNNVMSLQTTFNQRAVNLNGKPNAVRGTGQVGLMSTIAYNWVTHTGKCISEKTNGDGDRTSAFDARKFDRTVESDDRKVYFDRNINIHHNYGCQGPRNAPGSPTHF